MWDICLLGERVQGGSEQRGPSDLPPACEAQVNFKVQSCTVCIIRAVVNFHPSFFHSKNVQKAPEKDLSFCPIKFKL